MSGAERAARLALLEAACEDLAGGTGDRDLDVLLSAVLHRLAALALGGAP